MQALDINYSRLLRALDAWHDEGGEPRTYEQLKDGGISGPELMVAKFCRCITQDPITELFSLESRELIGPVLGDDLTRAHRIQTDLLDTMSKNAKASKRIERSSIVFVKREFVSEYQEWCRARFGALLREADDLAMKHYDKNGVRVGVSIFQYDASD